MLLGEKKGTSSTYLCQLQDQDIISLVGENELEKAIMVHFLKKMFYVHFGDFLIFN
jgi:hypothetical protein